VGLSRLSARQLAAVDALVIAGRLERVPVDEERAAVFARSAGDRLDDIARVKNASVAYGIAYDAIHDVGEALLAAYGLRTRSGRGQHEALGQFLRAILLTPPGDHAAAEFDRLRKARNLDRYEGKPIGSADVVVAEAAARDLAAAAREMGIGS
jgi:hypothetical protein